LIVARLPLSTLSKFPLLSPNRLAYMKKRAILCQNPITAYDIFMYNAWSLGYDDHFYLIKKILLTYSAFVDWEYKIHVLFYHPRPEQKLPIGKNHATGWYVLDRVNTVHVGEASQEGIRKTIHKFF
jgi:hypothetical protein